jgi:phosphoribosylglycinamide formyltransferase-1
MNIAIFASGEGTNAENIVQFLRNSDNVLPVLIYTNNKDVGVLKRMEKFNIETLYLDWKEIQNNPEILESILDKLKVEGIVLAGFLKLIPEWLINKYPKRIINIHPALLPSDSYGGKGMYGMAVHQKIFDNKKRKCHMP